MTYNETIYLWYPRQGSYMAVRVFRRQTSAGCAEPSCIWMGFHYQWYSSRVCSQILIIFTLAMSMTFQTWFRIILKCLQMILRYTEPYHLQHIWQFIITARSLQVVWVGTEWFLRCSVPKCVVLPLGNSKPTNYSMIDAFDVQTCLAQASQVKDFSVWLTNSLTPTLQCQKASNKAMQVMEMMITRSFKYLTKESFLLLYKSLVQPHHEYCIPSWSSYLANNIDLLEKIQHCATKLVSDISSFPYTDCLRCLSLYSLYYWRQRGDLIEAFKIINNFSSSIL